VLVLASLFAVATVAAATVAAATVAAATVAAATVAAATVTAATVTAAVAASASAQNQIMRIFSPGVSAKSLPYRDRLERFESYTVKSSQVYTVEYQSTASVRGSPEHIYYQRGGVCCTVS
jgi:hypothetical protein